jgi:hypothetical protein
MLCPHTLKPCMDDICRGSGCMEYPGGGIDMIPQCHLCGGPLHEDGEALLDALICEDCIESNEWDDWRENEPVSPLRQLLTGGSSHE